MNILTIVQTALDEMGLPYPASIVSATDPTQRQCKALIYAACRAFRSKRTLPQLKKKYSFATVAARSKYLLPADYYAALPDTQWNETTDRRLIGPVTDADMTGKKIASENVTSDYAYRIYGPDLNPASALGQFEIDPVPSGVETLSFEYITKYLFVDVATYAVFSEAITLDTDLSLIDEELLIADFKWRYLRAKKKDYAQEKADADDLLDAATSRWTGSFRGKFARGKKGPRYSFPDGNWTF